MGIQERFEKFHRANPQIYRHLVEMAAKARDVGAKRLGIGMLWEVLRWNQLLRTVRKAEEFKLDNDYRSRYARLIMEREPDLAGVFSVRDLRAE